MAGAQEELEDLAVVNEETVETFLEDPGLSGEFAYEVVSHTQRGANACHVPRSCACRVLVGVCTQSLCSAGALFTMLVHMRTVSTRGGRGLARWTAAPIPCSKQCTPAHARVRADSV